MTIGLYGLCKRACHVHLFIRVLLFCIMMLYWQLSQAKPECCLRRPTSIFKLVILASSIDLGLLMDFVPRHCSNKLVIMLMDARSLTSIQGRLSGRDPRILVWGSLWGLGSRGLHEMLSTCHILKYEMRPLSNMVTFRKERLTC